MKRQGLRLVCQNYRCRLGEIDIIGWDGEVLVFAEVRYRSRSSFGGAADSVGPRKQLRSIRAAQHFLQSNAYLNAPCRFDVLALDDSNSINWIKDAFRLS